MVLERVVLCGTAGGWRKCMRPCDCVGSGSLACTDRAQGCWEDVVGGPLFILPFSVPLSQKKQERKTWKGENIEHLVAAGVEVARMMLTGSATFCAVIRVIRQAVSVVRLTNGRWCLACTDRTTAGRLERLL